MERLKALHLYMNQSYLIHKIQGTTIQIYFSFLCYQYHHTDHTFGDFGHSPREFGLGHSTGDWIILTNDDNYYVPTFIEEFTKVAESSEDAGLIYCDMSHNNG